MTGLDELDRRGLALAIGFLAAWQSGGRKQTACEPSRVVAIRAVAPVGPAGGVVAPFHDRPRRRRGRTTTGNRGDGMGVQRRLIRPKLVLVRSSMGAQLRCDMSAASPISLVASSRYCRVASRA